VVVALAGGVMGRDSELEDKEKSSANQWTEATLKVGFGAIDLQLKTHI
jgi:hypothetical protein